MKSLDSRCKMASAACKETARLIDEEVRRILEDAHQIAKKLLEVNKPRLVHLADSSFPRKRWRVPNWKPCLLSLFLKLMTEEARGCEKQSCPNPKIEQTVLLLGDFVGSCGWRSSAS
jgi:hypothetical protein